MANTLLLYCETFVRGGDTSSLPGRGRWGGRDQSRRRTGYGDAVRFLHTHATPSPLAQLSGHTQECSLQHPRDPVTDQCTVFTGTPAHKRSTRTPHIAHMRAHRPQSDETERPARDFLLFLRIIARALLHTRFIAHFSREHTCHFIKGGKRTIAPGRRAVPSCSTCILGRLSAAPWPRPLT